MASYKIYFVDFCHKNRTSTHPKSPATLQNATQRDVFIKNRISGPIKPPATAWLVEHFQVYQVNWR